MGVSVTILTLFNIISIYEWKQVVTNVLDILNQNSELL